MPVVDELTALAEAHRKFARGSQLVAEGQALQTAALSEVWQLAASSAARQLAASSAAQQGT